MYLTLYTNILTFRHRTPALSVLDSFWCFNRYISQDSSTTIQQHQAYSGNTLRRLAKSVIKKELVPCGHLNSKGEYT